MLSSQSVAPHLPHLRRFARALTGTQEAGDAYVVATLEAIIASREQEAAAPSAEARPELYKRFMQVWRVLRGSRSKSVLPGDPIGKRLQAMTQDAAIAFLLSSIEGFTSAEIARILEISESAVHGSIAKAADEITEGLVTDVLIIEDEPFIAMDLEGIMESLGHRVVGIARTHREALSMRAAAPPGLILADIQLADGSSGLDAVNDILTSFSVPVVFITAYPERLLTGEKPEPAFLITKPFQVDQVQAMVSQALFFEQRPRPVARRVANS